MAHAVATFYASKEFFNVRITLSHEAFMKSHELGMLEYRSQVIEHHQGLDLSFLNEGESKGEPSDEATTPSTLVKVMPAPAFKAILAKPIIIKPSTMSEAA